MKNLVPRVRSRQALLIGMALAVVITGCGDGETSEQPTDDTEDEGDEEGDGSEPEDADDQEQADTDGELQTVRVGLSAFQDVMSVYVGMDNGFFEDEGIELDIQRTDWPGANELLIGDQVDIATSCDADVTLQNAQGHETTLAFPLYYFAGGGLMYNPDEHPDWQTYEEYLSESDDSEAALRETLEQASGARVGVSSGGGEYATFVGMTDAVGLDLEDFDVIDLSQEELPPALLSDSIDIMISGIPQRLAVIEESYETLADQSAVPSTIVHCGFGSHRDFVDGDMDLATGMQRAIFRTLQYIEDNPDDAFPIISEQMQESGTNISTEELGEIWNTMEFFLPDVETYEADVIDPSGRFYWEDRFASVVQGLEDTERIQELEDVPLEDLNYGLRVIEQL